MDGMSIEQVAAALAEARRTATELAAFPGVAPTDLAAAYAVQDRAIALGGRRLAGWKVAMIPPPMRREPGVVRTAGPIFADVLQKAGATGAHDAAMHAGFAALEAEFVLRLGRALEPQEAPFHRDDLMDSVAALHAGVEIASSPIAGNGDADPCLVVADHGNNAGAILGPEIPDWRNRSWADMPSRMLIDGEPAGEGSAAVVPDGPLAALEFLANLLAGRGISLNPGDIVLTGQTTGVHRVRPGQTARVEFPGVMSLDLTVVPARPLA